MSTNRNETIQIRLTKEEKTEFNKKAKLAGLKVSEFVRVSCLIKERIMILNGGEAVAKELYTIRTKLSDLVKCEKINDGDFNKLSDSLEKISCTLSEILMKSDDMLLETVDNTEEDDDGDS